MDVSVLELFDDILEVRAVAGDNYLGGEDFTELLVHHFLSQCGVAMENLTEKEQKIIWKEAEKCKLNFSANGTSAMHCKVQEEIKEVEISLKEYTQLCQPLLAKIRKPVQRSLSDARLKLSDIDEIVLVGGATRLCIVRDFIIKMFHKFPDISMNPDEAVALGAAIQGAMKERNQAVKEVILTDVCAFTLGTDVMIIREDGSQESGHFYPIIERNTVIPASRTERFYTCRDNQDIVTVQVLQGRKQICSK